MIYKRKRQFNSSSLAPSQGGCALSSRWPAEPGFMELPTATEGGDIKW